MSSRTKNPIDKRGSMYTLEASIAIMMMIAALAFFLRNPPEPQDLSHVNYKLEIYNALKISDEIGDMRKNAVNADAASIKTEIDGFIPAALTFDVTIYNSSTNITALPTFDDESDTILTVSYLISGWAGNYAPREVRVFAWGFD